MQPDGSTQAGVLEGELSFGPLGTPGDGVTLARNQRSSLSSPDENPAEPQPLTDAQQQRLSNHRQRARREFSPAPAVQSFRVEGEAFTDGRRLRQMRPRGITFSGQVGFPGETEHGELVLQLGDRRINLGETGEWSHTWDRDPPPVGDTTSVTVSLIATNNLGKSVGDTRTLRIVNPQPEGDLPWGYEQAELDYAVASVAGRSPDEMEFPYHLFENDLTAGQLDVNLSAPEGIVGLAYSTRPTEEWTVLEPGTLSQLRLGTDLFQSDRRLWIRGWTADGVLGYPRPVGTFRYHNRNLTEVARGLVETKWEQFQRQNYSGITNLLSPEFHAEFQPGNRSLNRAEYEDEFLRDQFREWFNLEVFTKIRDNRVTSNGGRVDLLLEVHGEERRGPPFFWRSPIEHQVERLDNGKLAVRTTEVSNGVAYSALESVSIDHLEGFSFANLGKPLPVSDCSEPRNYDVCVELVEVLGGGTIDGEQGIAANPNTIGSSASHRVKFKAGNDLGGDSLQEFKIIYGAGSKPSDVNDVTSASDITTLTVGATDASSDIDGVTPEDGGTTLNISLGGNVDITEGDIITVQIGDPAMSNTPIVNPGVAGNYDVQVAVNDTEEDIFQLNIIEGELKKLIPSENRGTTLKKLSINSLAEVNQLPTRSLFSDESKILEQGDIYAVRSTADRRKTTGLVEFESIVSGTNGSATLRLMTGQTLLDEEGPEEYPRFDLFRVLGK